MHCLEIWKLGGYQGSVAHKNGTRGWIGVSQLTRAYNEVKMPPFIAIRA